MEKIIFIPIEKLNNVFDCNKTYDIVSTAYKVFMESDEEVVYILEGKCLQGVITVGDLWRYFSGERDYYINKAFKKVLNNGIQDVEEFFETHWTIREIPCVDEMGNLEGVYRTLSDKVDRTGFRIKLEKEYFGYSKWETLGISRFLNKCPARIYGFKLPSEEIVTSFLSDAEVKKYKEKQVKKPIDILKQMTDKEAELYWGNEYDADIKEAFPKEFGSVEVESSNGINRFKDFSGKYINIKNGYRVTKNTNQNGLRKIYVVGPCTVFGAYVSDKQTIQSYLQEMLCDFGINDYQVINWGFTGIGYELQYLLTEEISDEDIVILAVESKSWIQMLTSREKQNSRIKYLGDFSDVFRQLDNPVDNVLDTFRHVNYKVNKLLAEYLFGNLKNDFCSSEVCNQNNTKHKIQDYFISWDVKLYYQKFVKQYGLEQLHGSIGSIVMNCNPFTKGHRFLIETAAKQCDRIIIFVVEEDKSEFPFQARIEMVKRGVSHLNNVLVVPSGDFIISNSTFAQYFEKSNAVEVRSMDYDIRIFGEVVSDLIGIKYRFVGEEPYDIVTKKYNETMQRILPQYGIEVIEIPRLQESNEVISASKVRKLLSQNKREELEKYLPASTIEYMMEHALV